MSEAAGPSLLLSAGRRQPEVPPPPAAKSVLRALPGGAAGSRRAGGRFSNFQSSGPYEFRAQAGSNHVRLLTE